MQYLFLESAKEIRNISLYTVIMTPPPPPLRYHTTTLFNFQTSCQTYDTSILSLIILVSKDIKGYKEKLSKRDETKKSNATRITTGKNYYELEGRNFFDFELDTYLEKHSLEWKKLKTKR